MFSVSFDCRFEPADASFLVTECACSRTRRLAEACLLLFVVGGRVEVCLPGRKWEIAAGEAFLYRVEGAAKAAFHYSAGCELYSLQFRLPQEGGAAASAELSVPERTTIRNAERLTDLLQRYIAEEAREHASNLVLYHYVVLALCELADAPTRADEPPHAGFEFIASSADAFIAAHYREPIGTRSIARELHYNPRYLERIYRSRRGTSIRDAVYRRRIRESQAQLVLHDRWSVSQVAATCGFADVGYFRRVFRRVTGMTPNHYRSKGRSRLGRPRGEVVASR